MLLAEKDLRIIQVLSDQLNFSRAASLLNMSQPALSRALQRIEQDLGVRLFDRSKTHVARTPQGEVALRHARSVLRSLDELRRELAGKDAMKNTAFRVSFGPLAAEIVGLEALARYTAQYPDSRGQLLIRDWRTCLADLQEERADLAVTDLPSVKAMPDLEGVPLGREPGCFFCAPDHPLARAGGLGWSDLVSYPWVYTAIQARFADMIPHSLDRAGHVDSRSGIFYPAIRVETFDGIKAAVRRGRAIGVGAPRVLRDEFAAGDLVQIDFFEPFMQVSYGLIWRKSSPPSGAVKDFVDVLVDTQRELDGHQSA